MSHAYYHALSSQRTFDAPLADLIKYHTWFDQTKAHLATPNHRLFLHCDWGIELFRQSFYTQISLIPEERLWEFGQQHIVEDFTKVPKGQYLASLIIYQYSKANHLSIEKISAELLKKFKVDCDPLVQYFFQFEPLWMMHSLAIFLAEERFGVLWYGIPTRIIAEKLVLLYTGEIPTFSEVFGSIPIEKWMYRAAKQLSKEVE